MVSLRRIITILPRRDLASSTRLYPLHHYHSRAFPPQPPSASAPRPQYPSRAPSVHVVHRHIRRNSTDSPAAAAAKEPLPSRIVPKYIQAGDWLCSKCGAHNFKSRVSCFECQTPVSESRVFYEEGSWSCPICLLHVPSKSPLSPFVPFCGYVRNVFMYVLTVLRVFGRGSGMWPWVYSVLGVVLELWRGVYGMRVDGRSFG